MLKNLLQLKYILFFIFLFSASIFSQDTYTLKGKVMDWRTGENLIGALVIIRDLIPGSPVDAVLRNLKLGAATDKNGEYEIKRIPEGEFIASYKYIGYKDYNDTIDFTGSSKVFTKNLKLKDYSADLVSTPQIEKYQLHLKKFADKNKLIDIHLDSLNFDGDIVTVYSTVTNLSDTIIYIIKQFRCHYLIEPLVFKDNRRVYGNAIDLGCDAGTYNLINRSDLEEIEPGKSKKYLPTGLAFYHFKRLPEGEYKIGIKYKFGGPSSLTGGPFASPQGDAIFIALRGEFTSDNYLYFKK